MPWVLSPKQIWRRTAKTCSENPLAVLNFEWWICQRSLVLSWSKHIHLWWFWSMED
jgi:hypothetical protein